MSSTRIFSGFGSSGQNCRPEKVPMKPSRLPIRSVEHGSRLRTISWGSPGRSSIGASIGAGGAETGPANFPNPRRERTTERSEVVRALETKFLRFWTGQERDSILSRSPAPRSPQPASFASPGQRQRRLPSWPGPGLGASGRHLGRRLSTTLHRRRSATRASLPVRLRRSLRLPARSPSAADPSAADVPGPPRHHVAPRGERRCCRNASHLQSGSLTTRGHLGPHPGGGREVGHVPWLALGRFRARDRLLGRPRWSAVTGPPWPLVFPVLPFPSDPFRPSTYLGPGPSARERPRNTKTGRLLARGCAPGRMGFRWNPLWPGVGIIA